MNKELSGKGYIQGGEGFFITSTGERYEYHDGKLTQTSPHQRNVRTTAARLPTGAPGSWPPVGGDRGAFMTLAWLRKVYTLNEPRHADSIQS